MSQIQDERDLVTEFGVRWGVRPSRLHGPPARARDIPRTGLLDRLISSDAGSVTLLGPPGYGKTTVCAQYVALDPRPSAWLAITDDCNDLVDFVRSCVLALSGVISIDETLLEELLTARPRPAVLTAGACASLRDATDPFVLIVDDLHLLTDPSGIAFLEAISEEIPHHSRIVLASRSGDSVLMAELPMRGDCLELDREDLRFTMEEASSLFHAAGAVDTTPEEVAALAEQTEGWAVGLRLAAISRSRGAAAPAFAGDNRRIAEYLRENILSQLADETVEFLIRTSVLDEMSGALCDATLETTGSGTRLEELEGLNLMLVPLDRRGHFRYHHLLRDLLRMELEHRAPDEVQGLNARASAWCEAHGESDLAIDYAQAGALPDRVAELFGRYGQMTYFSGRRSEVLRWLDWLDVHVSLPIYPAVAALGGWALLMEGRRLDALRWADASSRSTVVREGEAEGCLLLLRAAMHRGGAEPMRTDVDAAFEVLPPLSPWIANGKVVSGLCHLMRGDTEAAEVAFRSGAQLGMEMGTAPATSVALAELALLALGRGDADAASSFSDRSRELIEATHLRGYATSVLPYATAARIAIVRGDPVRGRRFVKEAAEGRSLLTAAFPSLALQARIQLLWCTVALFDLGLARTYVAETDEVLQDCGDMGALGAELRAVRDQLDTLRLRPGAPSLSPAEARLLPLLTTQLSFREIGAQLHVSRNTVKTEAISTYRKLGVTSRTAAVEAARRLGLLA